MIPDLSPQKELSVVIPTYNRGDLVVEAIRSATGLARYADTEVIVVDDKSSDNTLERIDREFQPELKSGLVRLIRNSANVGVTGSKNAGAKHAMGEWIAFLDSDDLLRQECLEEFVCVLRLAPPVPLVFFRCADATGPLIGSESTSNVPVKFEDILRRWKWGDCLPTVRRCAFAQFPYDTDLRGFEGLTHCKMTRALGAAQLSSLIAVLCRRVGHERLSTQAGLRARSCELARGHWRMVREFGFALGVLGATVRLGKVCFYAFRCLGRKAHVLSRLDERVAGNL